jgi:hypothetical protein
MQRRIGWFASQRQVGFANAVVLEEDVYTIGFIIFIGGVAWALSTAGLSHTWVAITCVILLGVGILTGVMRTRSKDPSN